MSNESENKRIDLTQFEGIGQYPLPTLIAELKRCYEHEKALLHEFQKMSARIDGLRDILSILEDRYDIDMSQFPNYFASE